MHALLSEHTEALIAQRRQRIREQADSLQQLSCEYHVSEMCICDQTSVHVHLRCFLHFIFQMAQMNRAETQPMKQKLKGEHSNTNCTFLVDYLPTYLPSTAGLRFTTYLTYGVLWLRRHPP